MSLKVKNILIDESSSSVTLKINRPDCYNALNATTKNELVQAIEYYEAHQEKKCILITGEGKAFCSGQDLGDRVSLGEDSAGDIGSTLENEWNPLVNAIRDSSKIVITALNGVVAGAGVSVAFAGDLVVARPKVKVVSGFEKIALITDAGLTHTFTKHMGRFKTLEWFLFSAPFFTEDLHQKGLINFLSEVPLDRAQELATELSSLSPLTLKHIKKNTQHALDHTFEEMLHCEVKSQRKLGASEDYREGIKAFFEKRSPNFTGK